MTEDLPSTHYQRLGVDRRATVEEIRAAYVALARLHHPDWNAGKGTVRMAELNEAWHVLRDPTQRHQYDDSLGHETPTRSEPVDINPCFVNPEPAPTIQTRTTRALLGAAILLMTVLIAVFVLIAMVQGH